MLTSLLIGLIGGLLSLTLALPSSSTSSGVIINFDERVIVPVVGVLNPTGNEKGLFFNSFDIIAPGPLSAIKAHSKPNVITTAITQQASNGTPSITPVAPYKTFDLYSFYFGCPLNTNEGAADVATQCTILVAGFVGTKQVAVATYTFTPPLPPNGVPLILAQLPATFRKLTKVTVIQGDPTLQALGLDDVAVALYKS